MPSFEQRANRLPSRQRLTRVTSGNLGGPLVVGINPAGLDGMVFLAIDRSGGRRTIIFTWLRVWGRTGYSNGTDVMFVRSTDGGLTFSAPNKINDDAI